MMISFYAGDVLAKTVIAFVIFSESAVGRYRLRALKHLPPTHNVRDLPSISISSLAETYFWSSPD
jgi:hypothetical protein